MIIHISHLLPNDINNILNSENVSGSVPFHREVFHYTESEGRYVAEQIQDLMHGMEVKGYRPDTVILGEVEYKKLINHLTYISGGVVFPTQYMGLNIMVIGESRIEVIISEPTKMLTWIYQNKLESNNH
ncbi:hypothetical protein SP15_096 [Bacillus phage SP-15]|uniref:Uncharacterized protein n=1 Tax=Bacillus phage SP-15 TaxID=1792032 RepID=A0A127AW84_9CAUD|nr:hypothetical protein SP15_096 [Bacillus phage SP-15]AMM44895.1 hypothetical protein SP15_096 [Bacillus phage SP-15]